MPANHCSVMERWQVCRGHSDFKDFDPHTESKFSAGIQSGL